MYIYVFRYQFSSEVTDIKKFELQLLIVSTTNSMGYPEISIGPEVTASGPTGNLCGIIQDVDPSFEGFYANARFVAATAWAKPPLAEFTSYIFESLTRAATGEPPQAA